MYGAACDPAKYVCRGGEAMAGLEAECAWKCMGSGMKKLPGANADGRPKSIPKDDIGAQLRGALSCCTAGVIK